MAAVIMPDLIIFISIMMMTLIRRLRYADAIACYYYAIFRFFVTLACRYADARRLLILPLMLRITISLLLRCLRRITSMP